MEGGSLEGRYCCRKKVIQKYVVNEIKPEMARAVMAVACIDQRRAEASSEESNTVH